MESRHAVNWSTLPSWPVRSGDEPICADLVDPP